MTSYDGTMMEIYIGPFTRYNRSTVVVHGLDTMGQWWTSFNGSTVDILQGHKLDTIRTFVLISSIEVVDIDIDESWKNTNVPTMSHGHWKVGEYPPLTRQSATKGEIVYGRFFNSVEYE